MRGFASARLQRVSASRKSFIAREKTEAAGMVARFWHVNIVEKSVYENARTCAEEPGRLQFPYYN